jgi:hypothetical protein
VDHSVSRESVALLEAKEFGPIHQLGAATPRQGSAPDSSHTVPENRETSGVTDDPIVPVVTPTLLTELLMLFRDREVQVLPAPFR